jgi:hypothetical protein
VKTTQEKIEVMQHYLDGGKVDVKGESLVWTPMDNEPQWEWYRLDYRKRAETKKVWLALARNPGSLHPFCLSSNYYATKEEAMGLFGKNFVCLIPETEKEIEC